MVKVTLPLNASTNRKHKTQALMQAQNATTNGGDASRVGKINKDSQIALITLLSVSLCLKSRRGTRRPH